MNRAKRILTFAMASMAAAILVPVSYSTDANGAPAPAADKTMSQIYRERGKEDIEFQKVPPSCASMSIVMPASASSARATSAMLW